jgi:hypothetical protein
LKTSEKGQRGGEEREPRSAFHSGAHVGRYQSRLRTLCSGVAL